MPIMCNFWKKYVLELIVQYEALVRKDVEKILIEVQT